MHYPPITKENKESSFMEILKKYNVEKCFYGHLHGKSHKEAIEGRIDGIELKLISSDYIDFKPVNCIL